MNQEQRILDTGVSRCRAHLPGPPTYWSYSTLMNVRACPLRYALERARYPELWTGSGFPSLPNVPALFGNVVHGSVEAVVRQFSAAGVNSSQSVEATEALRSIGGLSAVVEAETTAQLAPLHGNPRLVDDRRERIIRELRGRIPEARSQVQTYLSRTSFVSAAIRYDAGRTGGRDNTSARREFRDGSHTEVVLVAEDLRIVGRIDLLTITGGNASMVDFKTGVESPEHLDQLRMYALLWERDNQANPKGLGTGSLKVAYIGHDVSVDVPNRAEIQELVKGISSQVDQADSELRSGSPTPVPSESNCQYCGVRHMCQAYWQTIAPKSSSASDDSWFDYEGMVSDQNGQRSWWLSDLRGERREFLLRTSSVQQSFEKGDRIRLLQLRRGTDPAVPLPIATFTAASEAFHITA